MSSVTMSEPPVVDSPDPVLPAQAWRVSLRSALWIASVALVCFLPLLLFGPAADPGIFYVGATKILHGGSYYADILDIKPPFIYWYYTAALQVFGESFLSVRLLDLVVQVLFVFFLAASMIRVGFTGRSTLATVVIYALAYVGLGPSNTTQLESYIGMFLLPAILLQVHYRLSPRLGWDILTGFFYGIALLIKPTLGLFLVGWVLYELLRPRLPLRRRIRSLVPSLLVAMVPLGIWTVVSALGPYNDVIAEINRFVYRRHLYLLTELNGLVRAFTAFGRHATEAFGPGLIILVAVGSILLFRTRKWGVSAQGREELPASQVVREIITLQGGMLLLSCLVELWFFHYHISRLLLPVAVLGGGGAIAILTSILRWRQYSRYQQIVGGGLLLLLLLYSPLAWAFTRSYRPARALVTTGSIAAAQRVSLEEAAPILAPFEQLDLSARMNDSVDSSSFYIISPNVGMLYARSGMVPRGDLIHGHQITSRFIPASWTERVIRMLREDPPAYIVIEWNDHSIGFQGVGSVEEAMERTGLLREVRNRYHTVDSNEIFLLLRRNYSP